MNEPQTLRFAAGRIVLWATLLAPCASAQSYTWLESPSLGKRILLDLDDRGFRRSLKPDQFQQTPAMPEWFPPPGAVELPNDKDPNLIPQGEVQGAYLVQLTIPQTRSFYDRVLHEKRCSQSFWQLEKVPGTANLNSQGPHFKFCNTPQAELRVSFRPESGGTRVYLTYKHRVHQPTGTLTVVTYDDETRLVVVQETQTGAQFRNNPTLFDACPQAYGSLFAPECRIPKTPKIQRKR